MSPSIKLDFKCLLTTIPLLVRGSMTASRQWVGMKAQHPLESWWPKQAVIKESKGFPVGLRPLTQPDSP